MLMAKDDDKRDACDEFVGNRTGHKRQEIQKSSFRQHVERAKAAMKTGDWSGANGTTLVALVCVLHFNIYGVELEMSPRERFIAARTAGLMLKREFGDDLQKMILFLRWTWRREREREEWRRKNGRDGGSIGWRLQFGPHLLTDYRLAAARKQSR